ncbi:suppressor of fused domain protein [Chryseolinea sp. T2]|uniref:suppressor of fused domain protein n=1 Tax=Chryseolinea sp. T2 TaxID=3129255 RepID=UPI0030778D04
MTRFWYKGPIGKTSLDFCVLEFPPTSDRNMWTYATCCMSSISDITPLEVHMFSSIQDQSIVELLTVVASYHQNDSQLDIYHTVNFGRPWQGKSKCHYGLISLPYLDGPNLEDLIFSDSLKRVKFYWLIPITKDEMEFKKGFGIESLEEKFEESEFNYLDANRPGVV